MMNGKVREKFFIIWFFMAVFSAQALADVKCYFPADLTNVGIGLGYFKGDGTLLCDDGRSVSAEFSGWSVAGIGVSRANHLKSYIVFTGAQRVEDIEGRYHGGGIQLSVPLTLSLDMAAFTNGDVTLKWISPQDGLSVGLPYKTIDIRFSGEIKKPSVEYEAALRTLGKAQISIAERGGLVFNFDQKELNLGKNEWIFLEWLLEEDGILWNSDLERNYSQISAEENYFIIDSSQLESDKEYYLTLAYTKESVPVVYRYSFTWPKEAKDREKGAIISSKVERFQVVDPF